MKRVAIIRGANLNPYEMQTFEPLLDRFDIHAIAARHTAHSTAHVRLPVVRLHCSDGPLHWLPQPLAVAGGLVLDRLLGVNQALFRLGSHLKGFDIVHTADPAYYYSYQAAKLRRRLGFKLIATQWENIPLAHEWPPAQRRRKRQVLAAADHFAAVTERAREALLLEGVSEDRITILAPGIDTQRFAPRPKPGALLATLRATPHDVMIGYVGKLNALKGVQFLLHAFAHLVRDPEVTQRSLGVRLALFGAGRRARWLQRLAARLGIADRVVFAGPWDYSRLHDVYNALDIFVLPSLPFIWWQEQFGMVLLEAMASGCAVVASASGSIPEVVGDAGILCQAGDGLDLYRILRALCLNDNRRKALGLRARQRAEAFDVQRRAAALGALYDRL